MSDSIKEQSKNRGDRYTREVAAEQLKRIGLTLGPDFYPSRSPQEELRMNEVADLKPNFKDVVARAKREVQDENVRLAVDKLKGKLREKDRAQTVLSNIDREIQELELKIEQGNL